MIFNSLGIDFIHGDNHDWSCKKEAFEQIQLVLICLYLPWSQELHMVDC